MLNARCFDNHLLRHPEDVAGGEGHLGGGAALHCFDRLRNDFAKILTPILTKTWMPMTKPD